MKLNAKKNQADVYSLSGGWDKEALTQDEQEIVANLKAAISAPSGKKVSFEAPVSGAEFYSRIME